MTKGGAVSLIRAWTIVGILSLLFVVSMVDRFALGLLVQPLKQDLGVSDVQLGFLFGSAFALFYGVLTIPIARMADHGNRLRLIVGAALLWSACTALSGFATSFAMLIALRIGLAIGEAALVPSAYSMIGDLFPPERRTLGGAVFNTFGMAGASGAYIIGSSAIDVSEAMQLHQSFADFKVWQLVFFLIGAPGVVLALVLAVVGREPGRAAPPGAVVDTSFKDVMRHVRTHGWLYPGLFIGAGLLQLGTNGFLAWTPTYLSRAFDMPIIEAGRLFGTSNLIAFIAGSLIMPIIGVWLARYRKDAIVLIAAACSTISAVCCVVATLQSSPGAFILFAFLGLFTSVGGASTVISSIHMLTPARMRATLTAALLICLTAIALGIAPPFVGAVAERFGTGKGALGVGMATVAAVGAVISVLLLLKARSEVLRYLTAEEEGREG